MSELWKLVLSLALSGTLLMLLLSAGKHIWKKSFSKTWQYYIWLIVAARLLLPVTAPLNLVGGLMQPVEKLWIQTETGEQWTYGQPEAAGVGSRTGVLAAPEANKVPAAEGKSASAAQEKGSPAAKENSGPAVQESRGSGVRGDILTFMEQSPIAIWLQTSVPGFWISVIWLLTAVILFVHRLWTWRQFYASLRNSWVPVENTVILESLERQKARLGITGKVPVYCNPGVSSPMLAGVLKPCIVLPEAEPIQDRTDYVLLHELVHLKKHDLLYKWLVQLCICIHWFNPFLRRLETETGKACELACDEAVLKMLDKKERRNYGDTLLSAMRPTQGQKAPAAMLSEGKEQLKERLGAIMVYRKITTSKKILGCFAAVLIGWCAISTGAYASAKPSVSATAETRAAAPAGTKNLRDAAAEPGNTVGQGETVGQGSTAGQEDSPGWKEKVTPYIQNTYYEYPYLMEIGWNLPEQKTADFPYNRTIQPADGTELTCFFSEKTKQYMEDEAVMDSFIRLYPTLQKLGQQSGLAVKTPFIVSIRDVSGKTAADLAEESYYDGSLAAFSAVFPYLEDAQKDSYLDLICREGKTAFFSVSLWQEDPRKLKEISDKAWEYGETGFYSITLDYMNEEELEALAAGACADREPARFSIIVGKMTEESKAQLLKKAVKEQWGTFYIDLLEE